MSTHNVYFHGKIRKMSALFRWKKHLICRYGLHFVKNYSENYSEDLFHFFNIFNPCPAESRYALPLQMV